MQNEKQPADMPLIFKILIMGGMALTLLIPLLFIQTLIKERSNTRQDAEREIIRSWGGEQTVTGPMICVPYTDGSSSGSMLFMPDKLAVAGTVTPEVLHRGIYDAAVYGADLELEGVFAPPSFRDLAIEPRKIRWDLARLIVSLNNPLGLREQVRAAVDGTPADFKLERDHSGPFDFTLSAPLVLAGEGNPGRPIRFTMSLRLKGGRALSFVPVAESTSVSLRSNWTDPSFFGPPLPNERTIDASGFKASWNLVQYRVVPDRIKADDLHGTLEQSQREWPEEDDREAVSSDGKFFGVEFMLPVDTYVKSDRSAKYGILFLLVPFIALLLFELFAKVRVHLVQYFFIGVANVVFYLLLISISEHLSFDPAYLVAAGATVILSGFYAAAFLKSFVRTIAFAAVLALFYALLFFILLSQDYALLVGALGIFAVLALLMLLTRKIDWFSMRKRKPEIVAGPAAAVPVAPPSSDHPGSGPS
jgi:inner membrane protein